MATEEGVSLNDLVEGIGILLDCVYYQPNQVTKATIEEARSGKLLGTTSIDLSSIEAMLKSMGL